MDELTKDQLIHHLIRVGGKGDAQSARDVRMLCKMQLRKYYKSGRVEEAKVIEKAMAATGHDFPNDIYRSN